MVDLLKKGDKQTFALLYDKYSAPIYGILVKTITNRQIAEDVLQDVFVTVFSEIKNFDPKKESIFIWIYKIAKDMALKANDSCLENRLKAMHEVYKTEATPLLELIYFRGFSTDEIVGELNISKENLQKQLRQEIKQFIQMRKTGG